MAPKDAPVGGQAVLEGVMMRGVSTWAVAVRRPLEDDTAAPDALGHIEVQSFPLVSWTKRHRVLRWPIVRGVVALAESLKIGFKALGISANAQIPPDEAGEEHGIGRCGSGGPAVFAGLVSGRRFFPPAASLTNLFSATTP